MGYPDRRLPWYHFRFARYHFRDSASSAITLPPLLSVASPEKPILRASYFPAASWRSHSVTLQVDIQSLRSPRPLCFAESDSSSTGAAQRRCDCALPRKPRSFLAQWQLTKTQRLFGTVHARPSASSPVDSVYLSMTSPVSQVSFNSYGHGAALGRASLQGPIGAVEGDPGEEGSWVRARPSL